jgi:ABC-2 type transport system permease protein
VSELTGTWPLVGLALRRDRVRLPLWVLTMAAFPPFLQAPGIEALYPTPADLARAAHDFNGNATLRMLYGTVPAPTVGAITAWRTSFLFVMVALAAAITVIRHTRADEESGRAELLYATGVGRRAPLAAALVVATGASITVGLLVTTGMALQGYGTTGAIAQGLSVGAAGVLFAAVGALTAQLAEGASTARAIALTFLAASFLVRAVSDAALDGGLHWLSWCSPLGWLHTVDAYGGNRVWLASLPVVLAVVVLTAAWATAARRDFAAGVLPPRPGPAEAAPGLRSPLALAWRLHRPSLAGWGVAHLLLGILLGGIATGADDLLDDSEQMRDVIERLGGAGILTDAFLAAVFGFVGLLAAAQAIQAALRLRVAEEAGQAELVLVEPVSRWRGTSSHLVFVVLGPALSLAAAGVGGAVTFGLAEDDLGGRFGQVMRAALVQLPAVLVLAGAAIALFGLLPRWTMAAWAALSACLLVGQVGAVLQLHQTVLDLSPFTHVPGLAGHPLLLPLALLSAVAAGLTIAGLGAFAHRDVG